MKRFVKIVFLLITVAMLGSCGNDGENNKNSTTLKALVPNESGLEWNNGEVNPVYDFINEATGFTVQYDSLPAENGDDKLNAIMAAGADYDFILITSKDRYVDYARNGALMDMKPLVEEYGPNIQTAIEEGSWKEATVGETYYAIPEKDSSSSDKAYISYGLMFRQDILDTMGMKKPTTTDELKTVLKTFKDTDPMGNGNASIPLTGSIYDMGMLRQNSLGGAFGVDLDWKDINGELVPYQMNAGYYDFLMYLYELYSEGLIDAEMPTNEGSNVMEKFTTGLSIARMDGYWDTPNLMSTFEQTDPNAVLSFAQPIAKNGVASNRASVASLAKRFTVIPANSKNYENTMKFLDKKLEPEIFKEIVIGKEGVEHTVDESGSYYPILPTFFENRGTANAYLTGVTKAYKDYWLARARKDPNQYSVFAEINFDYGNFINKDVSTEVPLEIFSMVDSESKNVSNITEEFMVNSIVNGITKEEFARFQEKYLAEGGQVLIESYNQWYQNK
ncbi:MAG: extracellular solute-binding protein [Lachnospirales bacterium]